MRTLMFGWEFPPHISGGLGTACEGIARGLTQNGVDVIFVAPRLSGDEAPGKTVLLSADQIPGGVAALQTSAVKGLLSYLNVNSRLVPYSTAGTNTDDMSVETLLNQIISAGEVAHGYAFKGGYGPQLIEEVFRYMVPAMEIAKRCCFDVIHAHDWMTFPAAVAASKTSGKPLIVHVHATEFDRSGAGVNQEIYDIERIGMQEADSIITVSEFTRKMLVSQYDIPSHKITVVHNAMPAASFSHTLHHARPFSEKIVSFVSRITYQKNPENFLYAAKRILEKDTHFRFVMAGNGDLREKMIQKAAMLGISAKVHFPGFVDLSHLSHLFSLTDVYVMPSVSEPFGISPLEAIKAGVPVIVSRQSGVQEVLQYALKVDWWNVDKMADAIYGLAKYNSLSKILKKGAQEELRHLSWEKQTHLIKQLYETLSAS